MQTHVDELDVLQAVRLKGRIAPADLATTLGSDPVAVAERVKQLVEAGLLIEANTIRLSPQGRTRLDDLLARERGDIDTAALAAGYADFREVNRDFKALVSNWQLKNGEPNSHDDPHYDAAVLARLDRVHERILPVIAAAADQVPRLRRYGDKLATALQKIKSGDTAWFTRPLVDSYHTVWFELHEELLSAAGLTREGEAKTGHAE
jgi:DNA-binding Lrp family transcriptional regulator